MRSGLWLHTGTGQWCKTHRGKRHYFGKDEDEAYDLYMRSWPYLSRGLPVPDDEVHGLQVAELFNRWLDERVKDRRAGSVQPGTVDEYRRILRDTAGELGASRFVGSLKASDFDELHRYILARFPKSPSNATKWVGVTRMPFRWGERQGLCGAVAMGDRFKGASKASRRAAQFARGRQIYTAAEVHRLIKASPQPLTAAIWLGINGGYTQLEIERLRLEDLKGDMLDHLRSKTKVLRTVPLWPETLAAMEWHIGRRRTGPLLVNSWGKPLGYQAIRTAFEKARERAGVRIDGGFGKLRPTFRTAADNARDANAIRRVMGHEVGEGVETVYIRSIARERLDAVVSEVKKWLSTT